MLQIDTTSSVAVRPPVQAPGQPGFFVGRDSSTGRRGTQVSADWLNDVQGELISVIEGAGMTPTKGVAQLAQAVALLIKQQWASMVPVGTVILWRIGPADEGVTNEKLTSAMAAFQATYPGFWSADYLVISGIAFCAMKRQPDNGA